MGKIELCGMRFFAHHGCFQEEKTIGNHFIVDFSAEVDMLIPSETDSLEDAVNYQLIYDIVKEEMDISSDLLEHVAGRIGRRIKADFPMLQNITVSVAKLNPPIGGQVGASRITLTF